MGRRLTHREGVAFDLTVMRAHDKAREVRFNYMMGAGEHNDPTGMGRMLGAIRLIYEDQ